MVIVLIRWFIKPNRVADFFEYWQTKAIIEDKSGLIGEFLSEPIPAHAFTYKVDDLTDPNGEHLEFNNVGLWESVDAFEEAVAHMFNDDAPLLDFEVAKRKRTILAPRHYRIGEAELPPTGTCD